MRKKIPKYKPLYEHFKLYSIKYFAWLPTKVLDLKTGIYYRVWLESYYKNKVAFVNYDGEVQLLHHSSMNKLPYDELETLEPHPAHGQDYNEYYKKLHNKAVQESDPYTLMRIEIQEAFDGGNDE